jgi:hypothetical protein
VNKVRKAGIHESRIPSTEPVSAYLEPGTSPPHLYPGHHCHTYTQANKVKELHQPEEVIRKRGTGKFKELHKIEEIIIVERGARFARIRFI